MSRKKVPRAGSIPERIIGEFILRHNRGWLLECLGHRPQPQARAAALGRPA